MNWKMKPLNIKIGSRWATRAENRERPSGLPDGKADCEKRDVIADVKGFTFRFGNQSLFSQSRFSFVINATSLFLLIAFLGSCNNEKPEELSRVERLPFYEDATFTPMWLDPKSDRVKDFHQISSFSLFNQDGENITEKTFEGKIYVTDFFFTTCPGICPKMTANMTVLQEAFLEDDEVLLLSHSVTPNTDSIPILNEYATDKGVVSGKWHLVTGEREEIYRLGRKSYFVEEDLGVEKDLTDFLHTENFVLIDKNRHIRGIYNGLNKTSVKQLINDIKLLKTEES